jgi:hypothetical protein
MDRHSILVDVWAPWRVATRRLSVTTEQLECTEASRPVISLYPLLSILGAPWAFNSALARGGRVISPETKQALAIGGSSTPPGGGQHPCRPHLHELPAHLLAVNLLRPLHFQTSSSPASIAHSPRRSGPAVDTAEGCFRAQHAERRPPRPLQPHQRPEFSIRLRPVLCHVSWRPGPCWQSRWTPSCRSRRQS